MADKMPKMSLIGVVGENNCDAIRAKKNSDKKLFSWSCRILRFLFAFMAIDVFRVGAKPDDYSAIEDGQRGSYQNRLQRCWNVLQKPICIYLLGKPVVVVALRMLIHNLKTSNDSLASQTQLIVQLRWLLELVGDPFCAIPQLTTMIYLGPSVSIFVFNILAPYYFRNIRPFDCSLARFMLDPEREQRRIDRSSLEKVDFALAGVEQYRKELAGLLEVSPRYRALRGRRLNFYEVKDLHADLVKLMEQSNLLRRLKQQLQIIRPATLRADWFQYYHRAFVFLSIFTIFVYTTIFLSSMVIVYYLYWQDRYKRWTFELEQHISLQSPPLNTSSSPDCLNSSLFSPSELLISVEILISFNSFNYLSSSIFVIIVVLMFRNQLDLIESTRGNLANLLDQLHQLGRQTTVEVDAKSALSSVESSMYTNIIGLWTFEVESRRNITQIRLMIAAYLTLVFILTLAAFGTFIPSVSAVSAGCSACGPIKSADYDANLIAMVVWILIWNTSNSLIIASAIIPARSSQLELLALSILAQTIRITHEHHQRALRQLEAGKDSPRPTDVYVGHREMEANNPLLVLWRKIVLSKGFGSEHHSVKVFNLTLTYRKALELNFYMIALVTLLAPK